MVKIDNPSVNDINFYNCIMSNNLISVKNMYDAGHRITDLKMSQNLLDVVCKFEFDIELVRFFTHNILEQNEKLFVKHIHPEAESDIISVLIDKKVELSEFLIFDIVSNKKYEKYFPYFVVKYKPLTELIRIKLNNIFMTGSLNSATVAVMKFCKRYFNEYIDDKIIFMISYMEICEYGKVNTFTPRFLNLQEQDIIDIIVRSSRYYKIEQKYIFVELLLFIKKNITVTYKILKVITEYSKHNSFDNIIFEIFGEILKENLANYFQHVRLNSELIRIFYKNRVNKTVLCDLSMFMEITDKIPNCLNVDDALFILNNEKQLKQDMLMRSGKVFENINCNLSIVKMLSDIYTDQDMYHNMIELLFFSMRFHDDTEFDQMLNFMHDKYPNIMNILTFDEIIQRIACKTDTNDKRFVKFMKLYIYDCYNYIEISDKILICLVESEMCDTIIWLIENNRISFYHIQQIVKSIIKKCESIKDEWIYGNDKEKNKKLTKCYNFFNLLKKIACKSLLNWTRMCSEYNSPRDIYTLCLQEVNVEKNSIDYLSSSYH